MPVIDSVFPHVDVVGFYVKIDEETISQKHKYLIMCIRKVTSRL
jgi:hypothetical protein